MTAQPMSTSLAKVRKRLPLRLIEHDDDRHPIALVDRVGRTFCVVPPHHEDAKAAAELIRDAMNGMA